MVTAVHKSGSTPAVRQANALAKSAQTMDLNEKRLIFLAMSRIQWEDQDFLTIDIPIAETSAGLGVTLTRK
jgi:Initiator Replication protein.